MKKNDDSVTISIVTVSLNSENTIKKTIESVLNQTYKAIQYIIVDGGSTDGTVDIIRSYESKFTNSGIDFSWKSEPDNGISDAFNKGISMSRGEYIGFINTDDWYEHDAVETIVTNLTNKHDLYCGDIALYDINNNYIKIKKSRPALIMFGMYIMHPTLFVKKEIYLNYSYNTSLKIAMDYELILRIYKANFKIKYIPQTISNFKLGGVSSNILKMKKERKEVMKVNMPTFYYFISKCIISLFGFLNRFRREIIQLRCINKTI